MEQTAVDRKEKTGIDKTAIKNFAIYSRNKLMNDIKNKAALIGITESGIQKPLSTSTGNVQFFDIGMTNPYQIEGKAINQRNELIRELDRRTQGSTYKTAYETLIEEVAYTWFNRIIAIRFMEVNNYMPNRLRVLSSGVSGINEPELIAHVFESGLEFTEKEQEWIIEQKSNGSNIAMDELFQFLFIKQCNSLYVNLPELFEKTNDYTELLLTVSYNDIEGIIYKLVHEISEADFDVTMNGQIEIIGWLYQYYNSERKDEVVNIIGKKIVEKQDIPAATQLFTTDWVVKYMVDNSLGKYWVERTPNSDLINSLEYLIPKEVKEIGERVSPEDIKFLDNCMGSGHILIYAFEVLMKIYQSEGYTSREAAKLILEKNIYGLEIDRRSYQLSYFAIMMKARQYNRRILNESPRNNLYVFEDSHFIDQKHLSFFGKSLNQEERESALNQLKYLIDLFKNAEEQGSIINIEEKIDRKLLLDFIKDLGIEQLTFESIGIEKTQQQLNNLVCTADVLNQKYEIVVTNPPYLNKMNSKFKQYIKKNYKDYSGDLFSVFIYRNIQLTKELGYSAYMAPNVWMFIKTYEELRKYIINNKKIDSLIQIAKGAFYQEATVDVMTFVIKNDCTREKGIYIRLEEFRGGMDLQGLKVLEAINKPHSKYLYRMQQSEFVKIPGNPIAYWASKKLLKAFEIGIPMGDIVEPKVGLQTGSNDIFLKYWYEVDYNNIKFNANSIEESLSSGKKWFPYNKGGARRQWYGNYDYVVNWENDGEEIRNFKDSNGKLRSRPQNTSYYFKPAITWSDVTSGKFSIRYREPGSIHDVKGMSAFSDDNTTLLHALGLLSTKIADYVFDMLNPTISLQVGNFAAFPVLESNSDRILKIVSDCIQVSKDEWNSYEEAWGFEKHPLLYNKTSNSIREAYKSWEIICKERIQTVKDGEEELNKLFIDLYGLEDELSAEVSEKEITLKKANKKQSIKSFISYAIGCVFGRYDIEKEGLNDVSMSIRDKEVNDNLENVILINSETLFSNDITNLFIEFLRKCFGEDNLEDNLKFIADNLGKKGTSSREVITHYFINDFYKDHLKTYQKRPIYWLYDSGKQNGFKALVYMHRYDEDTTGKVRVEYLHQVQRAYERTIANLQEDITHTKDAKEVTQIQKRIEKLTKQLKECREYDERLGHMALERVAIDLDDGVKVNYEKVQTDSKGKFHQILAKI